MIKFWNNEKPDWFIEFKTAEDSKYGFLSTTTGSDANTLVVGLGERTELTFERIRRAAAKAVKTLTPLGAKSALLDLKSITDIVTLLGREALAAFAQGADLALYRQESFKKQAKSDFTLYVMDLFNFDAKAVLAEAEVLTRAVCFARDLTNCPANKLTPEIMAKRMTEAAERVGIETEVIDETHARELGMEAFLTVGMSALHPPRLIVLRYRGGKEDQAPIALVGKGITLDTGGYSLKPASSLKGIKGDMAGGAAVCGAIIALAENHVPVNVTAIIPAAENRISPDSFIPGDVIGSMSGRTIEIGNSDAEGRLILADAVTYAIRREGACSIVDIATLTGAVVAMFGFTTAGYLCNDSDLNTGFRRAYEISGEQYWQLPMFPEYKRMIESPIADVYNTSTDGCGTITAGLFIESFTEGKPWLHLDIAGTAWVDSPRIEYQTKGATGAGVTTLYELCKVYAHD